ncbi:hypothetical protein EV361DRAFT_812469 [Lentinula raphanica]|nr:hypothetical protein EV361DRAFT_812469 [Lentinula raphanica]
MQCFSIAEADVHCIPRSVDEFHCYTGIGKDLGVSSYILSSDFDFANALLEVVLYEHERDELFGQIENIREETLSPLSSLTPSPLSSPFPSSIPLPNPSTTVAISNPTSRKRHSKNQSKKNKKKRRLEEAKTAASISPRSSAIARHVDCAVPLPSHFSTAADARVASTAYVGLRSAESETDSQEYSLLDLIGSHSKFGFGLVEWDARETVPIVDGDGRVTTILVAPPQTTDWQNCTQAATKALKTERRHCRFMAEQKDHRRGRFPALSTGILYGNGMTVRFC